MSLTQIKLSELIGYDAARDVRRSRVVFPIMVGPFVVVLALAICFRAAVVPNPILSSGTFVCLVLTFVCAASAPFSISHPIWGLVVCRQPLSRNRPR
jgi:hypothetical protein